MGDHHCVSLVAFKSGCWSLGNLLLHPLGRRSFKGPQVSWSLLLSGRRADMPWKSCRVPSKNLQRGRPCGAGLGGEASTPSQCCHLVVWLSSRAEWHGSLSTVDICLCAAVCPARPFRSWDRPGRLGIGYCFTAVTPQQARVYL